MLRLPEIRPKDLRRIFLKYGFEERSGKGSHRVYIHPDGRRTVLAFHPKPVSMGVLRTILRQTKLSLDEIIKRQ